MAHILRRKLPNSIQERWEQYKATHQKKLKEDVDDIIKTRDDLNNYEPWEGAVHTLDKIKEADKLDSLEVMLKEMYPKGITVKKLNNLLWFEDNWVYSMLNIKPYDED